MTGRSDLAGPPALARQTAGLGAASGRTRRVLIATPWYPTAADPIAGVFCRDNARALRDRGDEVTTLHVSPDARGEPSDDVRRARYPASRRGSLPVSVGRSVVALATAVRARRPHVIHAHVTLPVGLAAAIVGRAVGLPVILTEHTGPFESLIGGSPLRRRLVRSTLASVATVIPVSRSLERQMTPYLSSSVPVEVVPNPVDVAAFAVVTPRPRQDRLLFVGRLVPEKRLDDLFAAFQILRRNRPGATLLLVGEGSERVRLEAQAGQAAFGGSISFAGRADRAGVALALAAADILVLPSQAETFGVVLVEALAAGRPVVATACGGPETIVGPAVGSLVPVGDRLALAAALADVLDREFDAASLRAYAAAWSFPAIADRLNAIYDRTLRC